LRDPRCDRYREQNSDIAPPRQGWVVGPVSIFRPGASTARSPGLLLSELFLRDALRLLGSQPERGVEYQDESPERYTAQYSKYDCERWIAARQIIVD
jgi:hypothetical protein